MITIEIINNLRIQVIGTAICPFYQATPGNWIAQCGILDLGADGARRVAAALGTEAAIVERGDLRDRR